MLSLDDARRDELKITNEILGTLIETVVMDSAADTAGLKPGDVLTALDGKPTPDLFWVQSLLSASGPGAKTTLTILRQGESLQLEATLTETPSK